MFRVSLLRLPGANRDCPISAGRIPLHSFCRFSIWFAVKFESIGRPKAASLRNCYESLRRFFRIRNCCPARSSGGTKLVQSGCRRRRIGNSHTSGTGTRRVRPDIRRFHSDFSGGQPRILHSLGLGLHCRLDRGNSYRSQRAQAPWHSASDSFASLSGLRLADRRHPGDRRS